ncbi:MAG: leucine-rich repeat domain-containing protein [Treponema sp.]|jgi:hypothetical protein|nr:leucine-rich repeat domain-containing protein [Treponema sp.]
MITWKQTAIIGILAVIALTVTACNRGTRDKQPPSPIAHFAASSHLTEVDFIVEYNNYKITAETTLDQLLEALGYGNEEDHESNNNGYVNTIGHIQIFGLWYPDYNNTIIRVIYHKDLNDDSAYISAIQLYGGSNRGLKTGDNLQRVIDIYGHPDKIITNGNLTKYIYYLNQMHLEIAMNDNETVFYILLNYISKLQEQPQTVTEAVSVAASPADFEMDGTTLVKYTGNKTNVTIPYGVTSIGKDAFFSYGLASIGEDAFLSENRRLTSVTIPDSVTSIGDHAFRHSGITSITIPNSVKTIGIFAFEGCTSLASVTIGNSVTSIGENAFSHSAITSITIPNSVTSIGARAFAYCRSLTSVTIPDSVTTIGQSVFWSCAALSSVTIPGSVTTISYGVFQGTAITKITIPASVASIEDWAFANCTALSSVTFQGTIASDKFFMEAFGSSSLRERYLEGGPGTYTIDGSETHVLLQ